MACCVVFVQPSSCENRDLCSCSTDLRAGCMSVGTSSVGKLVFLHGVGIASGHSSSMVIVCSGWVVFVGSSFKTSSGVWALWNVQRSKSNTYPWFIKKSHPRITGVDRWSTTTNVCAVENLPRLIVIVATPQGATSLPSALTSLVVCAGAMCAWVACGFEITEQDAPESSSIRVLRLLTMPRVCVCHPVGVMHECGHNMNMCVCAWCMHNCMSTHGPLGMPPARGIWAPPCPFPWYWQSLATCPVLPQLKHSTLLPERQFLAMWPGLPQLKHCLVGWGAVKRLRAASCSVICSSDFSTLSRRSFSLLMELTERGTLFLLYISWSSRALAMVAE